MRGGDLDEGSSRTRLCPVELREAREMQHACGKRCYNVHDKEATSKPNRRESGLRRLEQVELNASIGTVLSTLEGTSLPKLSATL